MYFVSFTILILRGGEESKVALSRDLLLLDDCALRQKTETGNRRDISLDTFRIFQADSHHLIATANTDHLLPALCARIIAIAIPLARRLCKSDNVFFEPGSRMMSAFSISSILLV